MKEVKTTIGVSELPIIMGLSKFTTPLQLWRRKMGLEPYPEISFPMKVGIALEEPAFKLYCEHQNLVPDNFKKQFYVQEKNREWLHGYIDFYNEKDGQLFEFKVVSRVNSIDAYKVQVNGYLALTGLSKGKLVYLVNNWGFKEFDIEFDKELWEKSLKAADYFHECILRNEPPINLTFMNNTWQEVQEMDSELISILYQLDELEDEYDELTKKRDELREKAKTIMINKGYPKVITNNFTAILTESKRTSYDYKAMANDGIDIEKYKKETTVQSFTFKKINFNNTNSNSDGND